MRHKKTSIITLISAIAIVVVAIGIFVPLGSYTTRGGTCPQNGIGKERLHYILGETLDEVKRKDNTELPGIIQGGCSIDVEYVLYFL